MLKKKLISIVSALLFIMLVATAVAVFSFTEKSVATAPPHVYQGSVRPNEGIVVYANQAEVIDDTRIVSEWEGRNHVVKWLEDDKLQWIVDVDEAGQYELSFGYYPLEGNGQDIEFLLSVDGILISDVPFTLNRVWRDEGESDIKSNGNQLRPKQVEQFMWLETKVREAGGLSAGALKLNLTKGRHRIEVINHREAAYLDYLLLTKYKPSVHYKDYASNVSNAPELKGYQQIVQAEAPYLKSSAGIFPTVDRSSSYTQPYHPVKIRMNTIGGTNWDVPGQWISWKVQVPESGWYKLGMRYRQNKVKGSFVSRTVYIDDKVPFAELENVRFLYDTAWKIKELGDESGDPFLIYLDKGSHEIKMEVSLGELAGPLQQLQEVVYDLNQIYRKIVMITGVTPDPFRDYDLDKSIPELVPEFERLSAELEAQAKRIDELSNQQNTTTASIRLLSRQLNSFIARPDTIPKRLDSFKGNITGLADVLLSVRSQPLELDYIYIASPDVKRPKAEANVLERVIHELRAFAGSFLHNVDTMGSNSNNADALEVWIGLGRDQAYVLNRMIEESFTPETGIEVKLNLVDGALVKAVMAGVGPDIHLFTSRGDVMNLAIRGALEPLDGYDGFEELTAQYMDSAFVPYVYKGKTYAIPDEQVFFMMFYREDILQELGLQAPQTWTELMQIAPVLQNNNLQIGLPYESIDAYGLLNQGMGLLNLFPTLLMQHGTGVYNEQLTATRFDEPAAYQAFVQWTSFYNLYDYPLYKNDFNRFRTGEMPVVISSYKLYNMLVGAAPEIQGTWRMVPIPGTVHADNTINRTSAANGTAGVILKKSKKKDDAWKFMKWWNSPEIQSQFVKELESELGVLGRRTPANVKAFSSTNWSRDEQTMLLEQWSWVQEVPELPGGYYTSRNIDNAFRSVVIQWENPREALFKWNKEINEEIARKRYEFGVGEE